MIHRTIVKSVRKFFNIVPSRPATANNASEINGRFPSILQFEPTGICNLRCTMCATTFYPTNKTMSPSLIEAILNAVPHCSHVIPYLGGEPFVYSRMPELLLNIRRLNDRCYIGFNTNATLIDDKRAETIMEARVNEVIFSVDGATAETYNRIRVGANFDTTLRNIRRITTLRDRNPNLRLGILLTATKSNYQEIPDLIKLASDLGLNRVMINGTEPYDEKTSHDILYSTEPSPDIVEFFEKIVLQAQDLGMDIQVPLLKPLDEPTFCPSLSTMLIRADGEVYPCSYFSTDDPFFWFGERRKHLGPISFGNIAENPIDVIWNSERYVQFRAGLKQGKFHPECRQCLLAHGVTCNAQIFRIR